jgi:TPR repeat protein
MYEYGRGGLPKDDTEAVKWFIKAAVHGNLPAQDYLKGRNLTW